MNCDQKDADVPGSVNCDQKDADVPGSGKIVKAAIVFSISSVAMIILNKAAAVFFPHVALLLILQNSATILILAITSDIQPFCRATALKWMPCALLFCVNLFSSLQSLVFISVPTFTVLRNTQPILAVLMDSILRGGRTKSESIGYLVQILVGAVLYCSHDIQFQPRGYFWAAVHVCSMTYYSILVKIKCSSLGLSAKDMSYYNNVLSVPGLVLVGVFQYLFHNSQDGHVVYDFFSCGSRIWCWPVLLCSCVCGYCVSVSGFQAQQVMSPISWLCLNNFSKVPAILISIVLFGGHFSTAMVHGMGISIFCAYFYSVASKQKTSFGMQLLGAGLALSSSFWIGAKILQS
jgi:hypothetical protein